MPGRVKNVDAAAVIIELQDGAGDGNSALFFNLHPIADGVTLSLARLDRAGQMDCAAVEQQFFGESGFAGVGVGDDCERPAPIDFIDERQKISSFQLKRRSLASPP